MRCRGQSFGPLARWMSARNQAMPKASTFSHCSGVSRMERCKRRSSGGFGGLPILGLSGFIGEILEPLCESQKVLVTAYFLNHNN